MPKISAPTLVEHQSYQRHALVSAAIEVLAEEGVTAMNPASVGRRASLARSSTYQYFDSGAALLAAAVEAAQAEVDDVVSRAAADAAGPADTVDSYVTAVLGVATTAPFRALRALERADLPPMCAARLHELATAQRSPLVAALAELGVADPVATADLVVALVEAAAAQVCAGAGEVEVRGRTLGLLHRGVCPD